MSRPALIPGACQTRLAVRDYDLAATLASGQAFRWQWGASALGVPPSSDPVRVNAEPQTGGSWEGIIGEHWVRLTQTGDSIFAESASPVRDWNWLAHYLQTDLDLAPVLASFPGDPPMRAAVEACRGLRLLRQPPWECLASFILSSTKQIVQIQQIVAQLCRCFGEPLGGLPDRPPPFSFPTAARLASCGEEELRACKMGFRAPYLKATAQMVANGSIDLERLSEFSCEEARDHLLRCPGVGRKIADCVLLFAYGFQEAFPLDVWVLKALRRLYFPRRCPSRKKLEHFAATHFGPWAGYAQQYLFHYMRMKVGREQGERV